MGKVFAFNPVNYALLICLKTIYLFIKYECTANHEGSKDKKQLPI